MATPGKFSFSGWNSQSLAPKINPAAIQTIGPGLMPPGSPAAAAAPTAPAAGQLVGQTNAATNLPAWLQAEVDKLNAAQALRTQMAGQVTGAPAPTQNVGDLLQGAAAQQASAAAYNQQIFGMNEAARLQQLIQQRNQLRPVGGFGFNDPLQVPQQLNLDRQIDAYRNVNLPISAGGNFRPSGWASPNWAQPTWR